MVIEGVGLQYEDFGQSVERDQWLDLLLLGLYVQSIVQGFPQLVVEALVVQGLGFLLQKMRFLCLKWWMTSVAPVGWKAWSFVMVQLDKVEVCELKPKMLTKDEGGLVWRWTSNWVTRVYLCKTLACEDQGFSSYTCRARQRLCFKDNRYWVWQRAREDL